MPIGQDDPVPRSTGMSESGHVIAARCSVGVRSSELLIVWPLPRLAGVTNARYLLWGANTRATASLPYCLHELSAFRERFFACGETALPSLPALIRSHGISYGYDSSCFCILLAQLPAGVWAC